MVVQLGAFSLTSPRCRGFSLNVEMEISICFLSSCQLVSRAIYTR